jgi:DNA mismatch repair protein MutL
MGHITSRIIQTALATPGVRYTFIKEKKRVFELSKAASLLERVHQIFGTEYSSSLIPIEHRDGVTVINGLAGKPGFYRATNIDQYFFVNGRPVRDPLIRMGVARSFDGLVPKGKKPVIFLNLILPQREVDVNVHPTKAEVRFSDPGRISAAIVGAIRGSLERAAVPHSVHVEHGRSVAAQNIGGMATAIAHSPTRFSDTRETGAPYTGAPHVAAPPPGFERSFELWSEPLRKEGEVGGVGDSALPHPEGTVQLENIHGRVSPETIAVGQLFQTFLLLEDGGSLLIMDQHTVHERTLYEKFMKRFRAKGVERQKLLIPETVKAGGSLFETVRRHLKTFSDLGWTVEEFGENTFMVREVPSLLSGKDIGPVFIELAETIEGARDSDYETMLHELVSRMACRSAVMAGDSLTREEILSMVRELGKTELPYTCPHGRPIAFEVKKESLLRHFGRNT